MRVVPTPRYGCQPVACPQPRRDPPVDDLGHVPHLRRGARSRGSGRRWRRRGSQHDGRPPPRDPPRPLQREVRGHNQRVALIVRRGSAELLQQFRRTTRYLAAAGHGLEIIPGCSYARLSPGTTPRWQSLRGCRVGRLPRPPETAPRNPVLAEGVWLIDAASRTVALGGAQPCASGLHQCPPVACGPVAGPCGAFWHHWGRDPRPRPDRR